VVSGEDREAVVRMKFPLKKAEPLPIEIPQKGLPFSRILFQILEELLWYLRSKRRNPPPLLSGSPQSQRSGMISEGVSLSERQGFSGTIHGERHPSFGDFQSGPPVIPDVMDGDSYLAERRDERLREEDRSERKRRDPDEDEFKKFREYFKPEDYNQDGRKNGLDR